MNKTQKIGQKKQSIEGQFKHPLSEITKRKRISTQPSALLLREKNPTQVYDTSLFHKTIFHLQPLRENPQLYTLVHSLNPLLQSLHKSYKNIQQSVGKKKNKNPLSEDAILIRKLELSPSKNLNKMNQIDLKNTMSNWGRARQLLPHQASVFNPKRGDRVLQQSNFKHITAKKWVIYDMRGGTVIKGYKYKKTHDIASLSKLLTFYTAYAIVQKYFISISTLQMAVQSEDTVMKGTTIALRSEDIVNLQDMLYAMMVSSANNAATVIANNLGHYVVKKRRAEYFSCFDINDGNRGQNIDVFLQLMNSHAQELDLKETHMCNVHGMGNNIASALDVGKLVAACFRIPLFCKVVATKAYAVSPKCISSKGECTTRTFTITNTNKLLWGDNKCVGGKTGSNSQGGQCFVACYSGGIAVVVLASAGRDEKFSDSQKLIHWLEHRLQQIQ